MRQEKKLNNSVEPVNILGTQTILHQMMNCICKLKINKVNGTGFFCKIPFGNNVTKYFLMTNHHILNKKHCDINTKINLLINDEKEIKAIDLRIKRTFYFNEENDITLIEINKNDNIKYFLELDDNLFRHNNKILYEHKSLYVLQYPQGKNAAVSYGLLTSLDNLDIKHTCSTENGSSGSPILNLETNKVIGIHKEGSTIFDFNKGTYLKYALIDFINKNKINNNDNIINDMPNINFQNNLNFNINTLDNINIGINNCFNQINNFSEYNANLVFNELENPFYYETNKPGPLTTVFFQDNLGKKTSLILNPNTTVAETLYIYLKKIGKSEMFGKVENIEFIYNSEKLNFSDSTPLYKFLVFKNNTLIIVSWKKNLLGGP